MKAIETKYLSPTDTKGTRIKAYDMDGNQITIARHYDLDIELDHKRAAEALCAKLEWKGKLVGGATKTGYAWVFVNLT